MKKKYFCLAILFLFSHYGFSFENNDNIPCTYVYPDLDEDGFFSTIKVCLDTLDSSVTYQSTIGNDCYDNDFNFYPGAIYYKDLDGDGYGNPLVTITITSCEVITGYIYYGIGDLTDCNDTNASLNPNTVWFYDADNDGFGSTTQYATPQCIKPTGFYVLNNTDCNDNNANANMIQNWYPDLDNDGYGNGIGISSCGIPVIGYVTNNLDTTPTVFGPIQGSIVPSQTAVYGTDKNYIITSVPKIPVTNLQSISNSKDVSISIAFFDGLGRPIQKIENQQSNTGKNIITPIEYDQLGREVKEYLPYATTSIGLDFVSSAITDQPNFSEYSGQVSFSEKQFEPSPLNRLLQQASPGNDWSLANNHTIKLEYQTNTANEVKLFQANASVVNLTVNGYYAVSLTQTINYGANQLYKSITKNENWVANTSNPNDNTTEEFKDKEGRIILKRAYNNGSTFDTYYVYDQYGNLTYVIPPLVTNALDGFQLDGLCYQYRYDYRNRLVEKKLPGKQWEFIIYDRLDRVIATGPNYSPFSDQQPTTPTTAQTLGWMITKYDVYNRPLYTAWQQSSTVTTAGRNSLQNIQNGLTTALSESKTTTGTIDGVSVFYSNLVAPTVFKLLTVNYYDNYNFPNAPTVPANVDGQLVYYNNTIKPIGMLTGSWVRVVETSTTTPIKAEIGYTLYDKKSHILETKTTNYLGGYTTINNNINAFTGRINYSLTKHKRLNADPVEITIKDIYTYSDQDRLLNLSQQLFSNGVAQVINGSTTQLLVKNDYDELGKLITKRVGGTDLTGATALQKQDYTYNIRGWLKGINNDPTNNLQLNVLENDLFAFKINYNTIQTTSLLTGLNTFNGKALYNGNISETYWRTKNDNIIRKYSYEYDNLNRLTNAVYQKPDAAVPVTNSYNENMQYDKNGNITFLHRSGNLDSDSFVIDSDNLNYAYSSTSNKLAKITDSTTDPSGFKDDSIDGFTDTVDDYGYDTNGNMVYDQNKKITNIKYNNLNLPTEIIFTATKKINYIYNALGIKLKKVVTNGTVITTVDYLNGFQYLNAVLDFFPTAEGYVKNTVVNTVNVYNYVYQYKDHLGNVRLSYCKDPITGIVKIIDEINYYPFGLQHSNYNGTQYEFFEAQPNGSGYNIPILIASIPTSTVITKATKYKYNGKEFQDELGLNLYDYGARNYEPAIGRWMNIDPLAEISRRWSPYNYAMNNPLYFIDPDGMTAARFDGVVYGRGHWSNAFRQTSSDEETPPDDITVGADGKVTNVVKKAGENQVYQDGKKIDVDTTIKNAKDVKAGDFIVDDELFRLVKNIKIFRIDMDLPDDYGHWWVEIGSDESYGWWPQFPTGGPGALTGVDGELNGQTHFGGTPTQDPHHGDRWGVNTFNLYTKDGKTSTGVINSVRNYAKNYSGSWSWPFGQNCHSFQEGFIEQFNLTTDPND